MKKEDLIDLSDEELQQKEKNTKTLISIFIPLVLLLLYFEIDAYYKGKGIMPMSIITICAIGGLVSLLPDLRKIKQELKKRI